MHFISNPCVEKENHETNMYTSSQPHNGVSFCGKTNNLTDWGFAPAFCVIENCRLATLVSSDYGTLGLQSVNQTSSCETDGLVTIARTELMRKALVISVSFLSFQLQSREARCWKLHCYVTTTHFPFPNFLSVCETFTLLILESRQAAGKFFLSKVIDPASFQYTNNHFACRFELDWGGCVFRFAVFLWLFLSFCDFFIFETASGQISQSFLLRCFSSADPVIFCYRFSTTGFFDLRLILLRLKINENVIWNLSSEVRLLLDTTCCIKYDHFRNAFAFFFHIEIIIYWLSCCESADHDPWPQALRVCCTVAARCSWK